jgi:hypothetical protein
VHLPLRASVRVRTVFAMRRAIAIACLVSGCKHTHTTLDAAAIDAGLELDASTWCTIHDAPTDAEERCYADEHECWSSLRQPRAVCLAN